MGSPSLNTVHFRDFRFRLSQAQKRAGFPTFQKASISRKYHVRNLDSRYVPNSVFLSYRYFSEKMLANEIKEMRCLPLIFNLTWRSEISFRYSYFIPASKHTQPSTSMLIFLSMETITRWYYTMCVCMCVNNCLFGRDCICRWLSL